MSTHLKQKKGRVISGLMIGNELQGKIPEIGSVYGLWLFVASVKVLDLG